MLKDRYVGLSGLFSLSGAWVERNEPNERNQPNKPDTGVKGVAEPDLSRGLATRGQPGPTAGCSRD